MSAAEDRPQLSSEPYDRLQLSNDLYTRGLWIGGGILWGTLETLEKLIRQAADEQGYPPNDPERTELRNLANACHAELTKRPKQDWRNLL